MFNDRRRAPSKQARTVYLVAPAGHPNYSDELTLRVWLTLLARVEPEAMIRSEERRVGKECPV